MKTVTEDTNVAGALALLDERNARDVRSAGWRGLRRGVLLTLFGLSLLLNGFLLGGGFHVRISRPGVPAQKTNDTAGLPQRQQPQVSPQQAAMQRHEQKMKGRIAPP